MKYYLISLILLPYLLIGDCCCLYVYPDVTFSGSVGYKHQEISLGYREHLAPDKKTIEQKINNLQDLYLSLEAKIFEPCWPYFRALFTSAYGWANKGVWEINTFLVSTPISGKGTFEGHAVSLNTTLELGGAFRIGPIAFAPFLGFIWQRQNLHLTSLTQALFPGGDFHPTHYFWYRFITPGIGLRVAILPTLYNRLRIEAGYSFSFGQCLVRSSYKIDSSPIRLHNQLRTKEWATIQNFEFIATYGLLDHLLLSLAFNYEFDKAKSKNNRTRETILTASPTGPYSFSERRRIPFLGFRNQAFGFEVKASYGF